MAVTRPASSYPTILIEVKTKSEPASKRIQKHVNWNSAIKLKHSNETQAIMKKQKKRMKNNTTYKVGPHQL